MIVQQSPEKASETEKDFDNTIGAYPRDASKKY